MLTRLHGIERKIKKPEIIGKKQIQERKYYYSERLIYRIHHPAA
jgi:hypothetical protein